MPDAIGKRTTYQRESIAMKRQMNVLLAWTGVALMLLGCTQDPVGEAPGGLEPSPSSQQGEDRDDSGSGAGGRGGSNGGSGGGY